MTRSNRLRIVGLVLFSMCAGTAQAQPVLDGGWYMDRILSPGAGAEDGPYDFSLTAPAMFRITDSFLPGDVFRVYDMGALLLTTTSQAFGGGFGDNAAADFGWTSPAHGSAEIELAAGSYSLTVEGTNGGFPMGFYVRLDSLPVPVTPPDESQSSQGTPSATPVSEPGAAGLLWLALAALWPRWRRRR